MSDTQYTPAELAKISKLFELLDDKGRDRLLASAERKAFEVGETICKEGETGDEFFLILGGKVAVAADDFGTSKSVASLGRGGFFGEMSVLTRQPRSATVTVEERADVLVFRRASVEALLADYPVVRQVLGKIGLMRTEQLFEKLSQS